MEEKIAAWSVALAVAAFAALFIYGCTVELFDGETIRSTAEGGIVLVSLACALASLS